ncbi:MAG: EpsD family peptidyl-prolyl cis-trans isomerase [Burkholderiales bacterium]
MNAFSSLALLVLATGLAACGSGSDAAKSASQVAAKVNKHEISVHQVNSVLSRYQGLPPEGIGQAKSQVLEKLIDQELLVQKAMDTRLERDPQVLQAIEATRRQMLAQAYVERTVASVPRPSPQEVRTFYAEHPQLFRERKVYRLQESSVAANQEQARKLQADVGKGKSMSELTAWLKAQDIRYKSSMVMKSAEQLPLDVLPQFHAAREGQIFVFPATNGSTSLVQLVDTQSMPLTEQEATPYIEQFLLNQLRGKFAEKELKELRTAAKLEYVGEYANRPAAAVAPAAIPVTGTTPASDFVGRGLSGMK